MKKHIWKLMTAVLAVGLIVVGYQFYSQQAQAVEEKKEMYVELAVDEEMKFHRLNEYTETILTSTNLEEVHSALQEMSGHGLYEYRTTLDFISMIDVQSGNEVTRLEVPFNQYSDYLLEKWDGSGLDAHEWEAIRMLHLKAVEAETAFKDITAVLMGSKGSLQKEVLQERVVRLVTTWGEQATLKELDPQYAQYKEAPNVPAEAPSEPEPILSDEEVRAAAKERMAPFWREGESLRQTGSGQHYSTVYGKYVTLIQEGSPYQAWMAKQGGVLLEFTTINHKLLEDRDVTGEAMVKDAVEAVQPFEPDMNFSGEIDWSEQGRTMVKVYREIEGLVDRSSFIAVTYDETSSGNGLSKMVFTEWYDDDRIQNVTPELTPEEAKQHVHPNLTVSGEPELAIKNGDVLVYLVPVEGVETVEYVKLNADTGAYIGTK
ncbi:hypothetical protein LCM20_09045 [Halobacillus litoralis]|uniref:hypothetical protein n=1 Tax=Halobacillus litoralis TaxID=45668 RepID=UPI001CD7723C|nr:hypothetical protein [Halobacillus litoralis]MCA0970733.1 hypothetical protein [Halobacillus litoralis]